MARPTIKNLDKMAFTELTPDRERHIAEAPDSIPPAASTYVPNQIAAALHPSVQHVRIANVIDRGATFKSYVLVPDVEEGTTQLAYFDAGQYLSVEIPLPSGAVTRPYSICSSPQDALDGFYQLTIERVEGGVVSDYIWDAWQVGTKLAVSAPQGTFTFEPLRDAPQIVALVGGSAITPIFSLAKAIAEGTEDATLTILYGTNTWGARAMQEELEEITRRCPKVRLVNILADEQRDGCECGFITPELVAKYAPAGQCSYFIAGPAAMRTALKEWIDQLDVRPKFIRRELFGEYRNPENDEAYPDSSITPDDPKTFKLTVHMAGQEHIATCNTHTTLLNSMERQGIHAPARCRSGECGWCHSRLIKGHVYVPAEVDGRRAADKKFGYIHPCASFPLSDIEIEVPPFAH